MFLSNKIAIITGGAKGVGRSTALMFAREGCSIAVVDISEEAGKQTAEEVKKRGQESIFVKCNVTDSKQVQEMVQKSIDKFRRIDILVNNAGGLPGGDAPIDTLSEELWDKVINLNLKSQFLVCKAVVPHMKAQKDGKIINISSLGAIMAPTPVVHYHAAKAGVLGLTYTLATELAPFNINVNAILPTAIATDFFKDILKNSPDKESFFSKMSSHAFKHRMCSTDDIAGAALFLASELSSYITGESISVSGGTHLTMRQ